LSSDVIEKGGQVSITDDALVRLRDLILSGELKPGSQLPPEQELASQLGVSRGSMREAVRALTHTRLVEVRRGLGTFVTGLEPALLLEGVRTAAQAARDESIFEIFEVRRILEPAAAGLAASRITETQLAELRGHLDAMRQATGNPAEFMHHDEAFHNRIAHVVGNSWLEALLRGLATPTIQVRTRRLQAGEQVPELTITQHERIYDALARRDSALAEATTLQHIASTAYGLRALLAREEGRQPGEAQGSTPSDGDDQVSDDREGLR
jgi:GntR family transcriptional regulator, transcriptional repressor for pyruvate dehydrogenase complex